jgi:cyclopropane fatty-acyl-phospholipid synthase-like methyltransferase
MNWQEFWNSKAEDSSPFKQVGRVSANAEHRQETLELIASDIITKLHLQPGDRVLDICCGNGELSKLIAPHVKQLVGVDFSAKLLDHARSHNAAGNISYHLGDALNFKPDQQFNKAYLYFSFQYFESHAFAGEVLANIKQHMEPGSLVLLGDVPDASRWGVFYKTFLQKLFYFKQKWTGENSMGKFWSEAELDTLAREQGLEGRVLHQNAQLPNAAYRFDYLLKT